MINLKQQSIKIAVIAFTLLAAYACNSEQSKKVEDKDTSIIKMPISEESIIKEEDKSDLKELRLCENLVIEVLTTSPRYKELTKGLAEAVIANGGLSFGISLEGSPNPERDWARSFSKTYDFTIYENYENRQVNIARFSFNPDNKQLYEYDAVQDQLKPIVFDGDLLITFDSLCK
ncbi:MAG: hypothetical protein JXB49_15135 [Bacteroidales bacterium]|nr:hypothetical protein [Bacteroidales bacterium]